MSAMDYDGDGRVSPFGKPDDALGSSARFLLNRGKYQRGEHWGYEVRAPAQRFAAAEHTRRGPAPALPAPMASRSHSPMRRRRCGCRSTAGRYSCSVRILRRESYNPSMNYALAICHLGDRILGAPPFIQPFPGLRTRADLGRNSGAANASDQGRFRHRRHRTAASATTPCKP